MSVIPHSRPWITTADVQAVSAVLASEHLGRGALVSRLERAIAAWVGVETPGVAVGSGSAAIALSLRAMGCGAGDEVLMPSYVCREVLEAVVSCGAAPVLCDAGPDWVVSAECFEGKITSRSRAIIAPHLYGIFVDIEALRRFGLPIVEDSAQAMDAPGKRPAKGDVVIFSFHPTKCLTSGEGGMAVTKDPNLEGRMRDLRDGGANPKAPRVFTPLSDLSAALCLSQLDRYEDGLVRRLGIASAYEAALTPVLGEAFVKSLRTLSARSMFFRFPVRVPRPGLESFAAGFLTEGIIVRRGVDELLHRRIGLHDADFPESVRHFETTLSLPIYPALSDEHRDHVAATARRLLAATPVSARN